VIALNLDTGKILWVQQVENGDVWHGCPPGPAPAGFPLRSAADYPLRAGEAPKPQFKDPQLPPNYYCPEVKNNPDYDFSAGQMLVDLPDGKSLVVAAQKSGVVWAFDPDREGALVWKSDISRGEVTFGAAADSDYGYFASAAAPSQPCVSKTAWNNGRLISTRSPQCHPIAALAPP
jgi:outer membrane protein assembly factor BamB